MILNERQRQVGKDNFDAALGITRRDVLKGIAQQGGTVYFAILFFAVVIYALWPRHTETFKRLAALPLEDVA